MGQTKSKARKRIQQAHERATTNTEPLASPPPIITTIFSHDDQTIPGTEYFKFVQKIGPRTHKAFKGDDVYAVKIYTKVPLVKEHFDISKSKSEKHILKMQHPFVARLNYMFQTDKKVYLVHDYCSGGELCYFVAKEGRFTEAKAKFYAAEIICAITHLMSLGYVHGSFTPGQVLLDADGHVSLTDFGNLDRAFSSYNSSNGAFNEYIAPEVLKGEAELHSVSAMWWSFGVLLCELLTGLPCFYSASLQEMISLIMRDDLRLPQYLSNDAKSLLGALLERDTTVRLGVRGGDEVKAHPWFEDVEWDKVIRKEIEPPTKQSSEAAEQDLNID